MSGTLAARAARRVAAVTQSEGQRVILRRPVPQPLPGEPPNAVWGVAPWGSFAWDGRQPFRDVRCMGLVSGGTPVAMHGDARQVERTVRISDAEISAEGWPGPPRADDWLILADSTSWTVTACDTRGLRGIAAVHTLTVVGGG